MTLAVPEVLGTAVPRFSTAAPFRSSFTRPQDALEQNAANSATPAYFDVFNLCYEI
ncbi:MAG: hypothetical protein UHM16_06700 [Acutalibacteraceae bacterium]|nr:hypothetical protein [Acutalibacteraceae bacterium]